MKITFINEIADLCEKVGADVQEVARGIGSDNRIGSKFLHAGPGYGGSCFPKDTVALVKTAQDYDAPLRLIEATVAVNDTRKRAMARKIEALQAGRIPIYEPGLAELVAKNMKSGQLAFTTELEGAVAAADAVFIAVGTPTRRGDGHADLSYVHGAAQEIARAAKGFTVVVTKSTVPVGTGDDVERIIAEANKDADVAVASNPEFLREGAAISDFKRPDRIVVGSDDPRARKVMNEIYRPLFINASPMMFTSRRTAELIKYAGNAFRNPRARRTKSPRRPPSWRYKPGCVEVPGRYQCPAVPDACGWQ
jgi:UDP-glucose 6-dehydrogenase